mgnify:CR=1 FL=1
MRWYKHARWSIRFVLVVRLCCFAHALSNCWQFHPPGTAKFGAFSSQFPVFPQPSVTACCKSPQHDTSIQVCHIGSCLTYQLLISPRCWYLQALSPSENRQIPSFFEWFLLDDNSRKPKLSEKRTKVSPKLSQDAQPKRARTVKTNDGQSWVDVVKSRPPIGPNRAPKSLLKRWMLILSL